MTNTKRRPTHKQILAELMKKPRVPKAIKELHGDIEEAIVEAGGEAGRLNHA